MRHAVEKCREAGNAQVFLTERGASFGYNNLIVDMRSLAIMRKFAPGSISTRRTRYSSHHRSPKAVVRQSAEGNQNLFLCCRARQ